MRELQVVIEDLAKRLHRAVAVDDPMIRLLAHTAHDEKVDDYRVQSIMTLRTVPEITEYVFGLGIRTATAPVRIPRRDDLGLLSRLCVPIRCQGLLLGFLWLIDDDVTLTAEEIDASVAAAQAAGEILFRNRLMDDLRRARERQLVFDLISSDGSIAAGVNRSELDAVGLTEQLEYRMVAVHAPFQEDQLNSETGELSLEAVLRRGVHRLSKVRALVATRRGGRGDVLLAFRPYEDPLVQLRSVGEEVRAELHSVLPGAPDVILGIGPVVTDVYQARLSSIRAWSVVAVRQAIADFASVTAWEDLGIYRVLQQLPVAEFADVVIPVGLRALLDRESDRWLVTTLDTYLDAAGNAQESAKALHIHRATLYYRLSRIEELTGMSLADGQDRLALHLGVKLARLAGMVDAADAPPDERGGSQHGPAASGGHPITVPGA